MTGAVAIDKFFTLDSWTLRYDVTDEATSAAKDLSAATVTALAQKSGTTVTLTATGTATGVIVTIPASALTPGAWQLQVRATIGSDTQTFTAVVPIAESFTA